MDPLLLSIPLALGAGALGLESALRKRDRRRHPAPGRLIDLGGHFLHARVLGTGDPVIVLEADSACWSSFWDRLPERLSEQATVIAYDRAGLGWSPKGEGARTTETLARELHGLLRTLAPDRPVVLVAHGAGARIAWSFAARYPFQVAGLVAVNGEHESLASELGGEGVPSPAVSSRALRWLDRLGRVGVLRALGRVGVLPEGLPATTVEAISVLGPHSLPAIQAEEQEAGVSVSGTSNLEIPVRVLVSTGSLPAEETPPTFPREDYNRLWARSSARLAGISSQSTVTEVDGHHFFHIQSPQVVEQAVAEVLASSRE